MSRDQEEETEAFPVQVPPSCFRAHLGLAFDDVLGLFHVPNLVIFHHFVAPVHSCQVVRAPAIIYARAFRQKAGVYARVGSQRESPLDNCLPRGRLRLSVSPLLLSRAIPPILSAGSAGSIVVQWTRRLRRGGNGYRKKRTRTKKKRCLDVPQKIVSLKKLCPSFPAFAQLSNKRLPPVPTVERVMEGPRRGSCARPLVSLGRGQHAEIHGQTKRLRARGRRLMSAATCPALSVSTSTWSRFEILTSVSMARAVSWGIE